jgi:hypothetical protein
MDDRAIRLLENIMEGGRKVDVDKSISQYIYTHLSLTCGVYARVRLTCDRENKLDYTK